MSDDEEKKDVNRNAVYRISEESGTPFRRVRVTFLGHITVQIRWSDLEPEARAEVLNLCKGLNDVMQKCFIEIDVCKAQEEMDAELAQFFNPKEDEQ